MCAGKVENTERSVKEVFSEKLSKDLQKVGKNCRCPGEENAGFREEQS